MAHKSHVTVFSQLEAQNFSVAYIYAEIFFIGLGPGPSRRYISIQKIYLAGCLGENSLNKLRLGLKKFNGQNYC